MRLLRRRLHSSERNKRRDIRAVGESPSGKHNNGDKENRTRPVSRKRS